MSKCPTCGRMNRIVNECRCDPNNLPTTVPARLTMEQRGKLARDVFNAVFDSFEDFREEDVGKDLAYLMGAILDDTDKEDVFVDWSKDAMPLRPVILSTLEVVFESPKEPIWKFIRL